MPFQFDPMRLLQDPQMQPRQKVSEVLRRQRRDNLLDQQEDRRQKDLEFRIGEATSRLAQQRADAAGMATLMQGVANEFGQRVQKGDSATLYDDHLERAKELNAQQQSIARQLAAQGTMTPEGIKAMADYVDKASRTRILNASRANLQEEIADGLALGPDSPYAINGQVPEQVVAQLGRMLDALDAVQTPAHLLQVERMIQQVLEPVYNQQRRLHTMERSKALIQFARDGLDLRDPVDREKSAKIDELFQSLGSRNGPKDVDAVEAALADIKHPEFGMVEEAKMEAVANVARALSEDMPNSSSTEILERAFRSVHGRPATAEDFQNMGVQRDEASVLTGRSSKVSPETQRGVAKAREFGDLPDVEKRQAVAWFAMRLGQGMSPEEVSKELAERFGVDSEQIPMDKVREVLEQSLATQKKGQRGRSGRKEQARKRVKQAREQAGVDG